MTDTRAFERMELEGWSNPSIAQGYADGFARATQDVARHLSDAVMADANTRALDLCTGHGVVAVELLQRKASVIGVDFSPAMIALAQAAVPGVTFVQGDAMALEFADASFDAVTIGFGVPHFPDPSRGLVEAARVLKPGGRIAFSIWQGRGSDGAFGWLFDAVERFGDPAVTLPEGPDAHLLADASVAHSMLSDSGFIDAKSEVLATELAVSEPERLFDAFDCGAVRAASLLSGQTEARREIIRAKLAERVRSDAVRHGAEYGVPAPSVVISAIRN